MPEITDIEPHGRGGARRPLLRFGLGLVAGFLIFAVLLAVGVTNYNELMSGDVELATSGADMSAHGSVKLALRRNTGVIVQNCNGTCDDLHVVNLGRSNELHNVRVLNEAGDCVACVERRGAVYRGTRAVWKIEGPAELAISRTKQRQASND